MAHLGQIDRTDPSKPVFVRYVTQNKDWKSLNLRIENRQTAELFKKENNDLISFDEPILLSEKTEIKILDNNYLDYRSKKYANVEFNKNQGYVLISKIRKPTDSLNREVVPKLGILAEDFTEKGHDEDVTILTKKNVSVKSFDTFDQLKKSIIYGLKNKTKEEKIIKKIEDYLNGDDYTKIDLNGIDDRHIDELGVYFGEVLIGLLGFKKKLTETSTPSDMFRNMELKKFAIPSDPAFKLVDSTLIFDKKTISISSKYDKGAAASFMTNVLPYALSEYSNYKKCFLKEMCAVISEMGYTVSQLSADNFRYSKNIMFEVGIRKILNISKKDVKNTNHSIYDTIRKMSRGANLTDKEDYEMDTVTDAIEDYFDKRNNFPGGADVMKTIRENYPLTITSFFNYSISGELSKDHVSMQYIEDIIGGKDFYQANLKKSSWRKGMIDIRIINPRTAKLKILGSMSSAKDYTAKHGMINYELI